MNCSVYIFGELSSGYTQYPEDSSSHILSNLITNCKAATQLVIKREDNLMYYSYIRKLENNKYIGLSILVNGYYIQNIQDLFSIFEKTLEELVTIGSIVCFSNDGKIVPSQRQLREQEEDIDTLSINLSSEFNNAGKSYKLPGVDYSIAKDSIKEYCINDDKRYITRSSYTYGFTYIYKDKDYNTVKVDSYRSVLNRISTENSDLKKINTALHEENQKILRKKKQFRNVILLILTVLACGVGLFFLNVSLNDTKNELINARNDINALNSKVSNLSEELDNTKTQLRITRKERDEAQHKMNDLKDKVGSAMPIIITDIQIANTNYSGDIETDYGNAIYSSSTMYLKPKISYTGIKTGENINLNVKFYTPSGLSTGSSSPYGCSYSTSMYVYSSNNTETLSGWGGSSRGHWRSGQYRFEIWYGDV